jgi:hypothetical protein
MYFLISSMENLVFIKELLEKNVEKVDSFHIYWYLEMNQMQKYAKKEVS